MCNPEPRITPMSKPADNPADPFKKALAETAKVMADDAEMTVTYSVDPAGMSKELVARLNAEAIKALNAPDVRDKLVAQGLIPAPMAPEQLAQFIREDYERWARVIKAANVKLD